MSDDKRKTRREIRFLQSESVWLQKALFALRKAEAAHEKLMDVRGEEMDSYVLQHDGKTLPIDAFEDALEARIEELLTTVRRMRREMV